jgi:hypothetical protein
MYQCLFFFIYFSFTGIYAYNIFSYLHLCSRRLAGWQSLWRNVGIIIPMFAYQLFVSRKRWWNSHLPIYTYILILIFDQFPTYGRVTKYLATISWIVWSHLSVHLQTGFLRSLIGLKLHTVTNWIRDVWKASSLVIVKWLVEIKCLY